MPHDFPLSPFVAFTNGRGNTGTREDASELNSIGQSSLGELHLADNVATIGLVCGATVDETVAIAQRLMAAHLRDPKSELLLLHTDHFPVKETRCPLLHPLWSQPRISVSPNATRKLIKLYDSSGELATRISFDETSITLRHVLSLFTPPKDIQRSSEILGTIQLILSQMEEPFELQRFIELVDQEKWSDEGANFVALRQTLLTRLLSPSVEDSGGISARLKLLDLSDPVLRSTGLDGAIMDIALYDFAQGDGGKKMIVLSNCQEYLSPASGLFKTLETLASAGSNRSAAIILSTTDPTLVSSKLLNALDYAIFGSSRSFLWNEFVRQHFTKVTVPKGQAKLGRAMIWSPGSVIAANVDSKEGSLWNDSLAWIDIAQFKQSMPLRPSTDNAADERHSGDVNPLNIVPGRVPFATSSDDMSISNVDEEEGIVPLDALYAKDAEVAIDAPASNTEQEKSRKDTPPPFPSKPPNMQQTPSNPHPPKYQPLISAISHLCDGEIGILVDFEAVRKQTGTREDIKKLGWTTFTQYVKSACAIKVVELVETAPSAKSLVLLPQSPALTPTAPVLPRHSASPLPDASRLGSAQDTLDKESRRDVLSQVMVNTGVSEEINQSKEDSSDVLGSGYTIKADLELETPTPLAPSSHIPQVAHSSTTGPSENHWVDVTVPRDHQDSTHNTVRTCTAVLYSSSLENKLNAADYPFNHQAIVSTMLKIARGSLGTRVRMVELSATLRMEFPGATDGVLLALVSKAENENVLKRERDNFGVEWVSLQSPKVPAGPTAISPSPPPSSSLLPPQRPLGPDYGDQVEPDKRSSDQQKLDALEFPTQHHAVISAILKMTHAGVGRVRLIDLADSLKRDYPSKYDDFVFSLLLQAEKGDVVRRETDEAGLSWVSICTPSRPGNASMPSTSPPPRKIPSPPPPSQPDPPDPQFARLDVQSFPLKHRAVVSVMVRLTNGIRGEKARMTDMTGGLRQEYRGAKPDYLFALVVKAEDDRILMRETDATGLVWVYLALPPISEPEMLKPEPKPEPDGPKLSQSEVVPLRPLVESYPVQHRPLASAIMSLTNGRCNVRVQMESVIKALMTGPYPAYRDAAVVASLVFQASDSKVVRCGQENGKWWTSLELAIPYSSVSTPRR